MLMVTFLACSATAFGQTAAQRMAALLGKVEPRTSDWGTVTMDLKSNGNNSLAFEEGFVPATIPIELYASATAGGSDGSNNGVQALFTDIAGTALGNVVQLPVTLDSTFTAFYLPGISDGLGFDMVMSEGTAGLGTIAGLGAAQTPPYGPGPYDMPGALTANAPHPNGHPPVLIATGQLYLDQASMNWGGPYSVDTAGNAGLWRPDGNVGYAYIADDSLLITVSPPPMDSVNDLDSGQTVILNPVGGSGDPSEDGEAEGLDRGGGGRPSNPRPLAL